MYLLSTNCMLNSSYFKLHIWNRIENDLQYLRNSSDVVSKQFVMQMIKNRIPVLVRCKSKKKGNPF